MTVAISEILNQVAFLSPAEQQELAAQLTEQVRQNANAMPVNGPMNSDEAKPDVQPDALATNEDNWWDVSTLNHVTPKWTRTVHAQFVYVGRAKPASYDFSDIFNDDEEGAEE